jgi:3-oxoadipate enol-lactonase
VACTASGGNRHAFDDLLAEPPASWRLVAWDMPGYGDSAPLAEMTWENLAAAAVALLDELAAEQAVVLGHSMGGMVAQELVPRHPDRLEGLILFATSAAFGGKDDSFKHKFLADRLAPLEKELTPADFADQVVGAMVTDDTPQAVRDQAVASMASVPSATYRQALNVIVTFDQRASLGSISCPVLMLAAECDALAPPWTMQTMAEKVPGARFECLPDVGHLANVPPQLLQTSRPEALVRGTP